MASKTFWWGLLMACRLNVVNEASRADLKLHPDYSLFFERLSSEIEELRSKIIKRRNEWLGSLFANDLADIYRQFKEKRLTKEEHDQKIDTLVYEAKTAFIKDIPEKIVELLKKPLSASQRKGAVDVARERIENILPLGTRNSFKAYQTRVEKEFRLFQNNLAWQASANKIQIALAVLEGMFGLSSEAAVPIAVQIAEKGQFLE